MPSQHIIDTLSFELHEVDYQLASSVNNSGRKSLVIHSRIAANKIHSSLRVIDGKGQVYYSGDKLEQAVESYNKLP